MPRILRPTGAVTAALTLSLLAPVAHADRWTSTDPEQDVAGTHYEPEPAPCGTETEVDGTKQANNDITRFSVRHAERSVVLTTKFRRLNPDLEQAVWMYVRTPKSGWWIHISRVKTRQGKWREFDFVAKEPKLPDPDDIDDDCGFFGVVLIDEWCRRSRELDFRLDRVRITVPRRCFDNPRWVRAATAAYRWKDPEDSEDQSSTTFVDEWDAGVELSPWMPPFGSRVRAASRSLLEAPRSTPARRGVRRQFLVNRGGTIARR